jgi:GNAT superfamily N-acetyltransferase
MNNIIIKEDIIPEVEELLNLYNDVQWLAYTDDSARLKNAMDNSLKVWTCWDDDKLVGLARVVGDGYTIIYIQDILVLESYQGQGIGSKFLKLILEMYKSVRQIVLMTDETEKTIKFYQKNGLVNASDYKIVTFMK